MTTKDIKPFLLALDDVKQGLTCSVCTQLCSNPLTFNICFHTICEQHYSSSLKSCPECKTDIQESKTFKDANFERSVESMKQLMDIFKNQISIDQAKTVGSSLRSDNVLKREMRGRKNKGTNDKTSSLTEGDENVPFKEAKKAKRSEKERSLNLPNVSISSKQQTKRQEKRNAKGETMLHISCRLGKVDKVEEHLKEGANVNTKDNAGWTPLHEVVQNGHLELVKILLNHNALINVPGPNNETPLHEAIRYKHVAIIEELIRNGADLFARNSKGETPEHLAVGKIKKILQEASSNIIQTQSMNVSLVSDIQTRIDSEEMHVHCASQDKAINSKLKTLYKSKLVYEEEKFNKNVTHLIVDAKDGVCETTLLLLQAIVTGKWVISSDWVANSTVHKLEPAEKYEVTGVGPTKYNGPMTSRLNRYKQLPGIFNGCHFYLHNLYMQFEISNSIVMTKSILINLITDAGGKILRRAPNPEQIPENENLVPYHACQSGKLAKCSHYIIFKDMFQPMYNMEHIKALPIGWLIECIEKYELCEPWDF